MANLFGFGGFTCLLAHQIRLHVECNTIFNWYSWMVEYNEPANQLKIVLELCKIQLYISIGSNVQDCWFDSEDSYFLRVEHEQEPKYFQNREDYTTIDDADENLEL